MKLAQLLQAIERFTRQRVSPGSIPDVDVRSLAYDSRQVEAGAALRRAERVENERM